MAFVGVLRHIRDVIQRETLEQQDAAIIKSEASLIRDIGRRPGSSLSLLMPQFGLRYERARLEDTSLRPGSFAERLRRGDLPEQQLTAFQDTAPPPQPSPLAGAQLEAFQTPAPPVAPPEPIVEPQPLPEAPVSGEERAFQRVLEVNSITEEDFFSLDTRGRVGAIERAVQAQVPGSGISTAEFTNLVQKELPDTPSPLQAGVALATSVEQAGREVGAVATTGIRAAAEEVLPGEGRPSLEAIREGGLQGAVERSIDVPVAPDVLNPLNLIALPVIDPLVARLISIPVRAAAKAGGKVTAKTAQLLGREAADKAADESLSAVERTALQSFSEEVERASTLTPGELGEVRALTGAPPGAATELPTGLPDPARATGETFITPTAPRSPVDRLTGLISEAKPVRGITEKLKSRELSRRVGRVASAIERGQGEQAFISAKGALKGELPKAKFDAPREPLGPSDVTDLFNQVRTTEGLTPLDRVNVADSLTKVLAGELPTRGEIGSLEKVFGGELAQAILSKRPFTTKALEGVGSVIGLPRAILTAFDLSAPLRQGALLVGHVPEFFGNFPVMIRAFAKQNVADEVAIQLAAGPKAARRETAGLFIADISETTALAAREEAFMTTLASKIPGVRQSQRAYVTYLNKLRADVFDNVTAGWDRLGISTPEDEAALANMLNIFSGRGNLGPLNQYAPILNQGFFSARLLASRPQAPLQLFSSSALVRKIAARDLAAFVGTGVGLLSMAKLGGADVELDPRSSNFAKIRVGPTRLDFWAGFQPIARYLAQAATGERKSALGNIGEVSLLETASRFLQSKLSPQAGAVVDVARGETFIGEEISTDPANIRTQIKNRLAPLFLQDLWDGIQEAGVTGAFLTVPAAFGASAQSYRTLSEEVAAQIAADIETGAIGAEYDVQPLRIGDLDGTDAQKFRELHPELIARQEEQFAGEPGDDPGRYFRLTEVADDTAIESFERIQESANTGVYGDFSEQDARRTMWDSFKDTLTRRAGAFETAEGRYPAVIEELRAEEPISPTGRALKKYFQLQRDHPNRETEEQWAAYEADLERTLTVREMADVEKQLVVEDHELEQLWHDLNDGLEPYYELPETGNARELWRRRHPQQDAQLWVMGRVSRILTPLASNIGSRLARDAFGQSVRPERGAPSGGGLGGIGSIGGIRGIGSLR